MKGARQQTNRSMCPLPSVQTLERSSAGKRYLEQAEGTKGTDRGTEEEVGCAVTFVSTGEVKEGGSGCSDPSVEQLRVGGGREAFVPWPMGRR